MKNNPETMRVYNAKWQQANKESLKQYRTEYYQKTKDTAKLKQSQYYRDNSTRIKKQVALWKATHKAHSKNWSWSRRNILNPDGTRFTVVDFDRLYQIQQGCCKICTRHSTEVGKQLVPDHNHKTGTIRGLLCSNCNVGIGLLQDSFGVTCKAAEYLKEDSNG